MGVKHRAYGMGQRMHAAQTFLKCCGAHDGGRQHIGTRHNVAAIGTSLGQIVMHQFHAFQSHALCHGVVKR